MDQSVFLLVVICTVPSLHGSSIKMKDPPISNISDKIGTDGRFLPFYGYTIVNPVQQNLTHVEQYLKNTQHLSKFLAPLPALSYHVTYFDIFTQRNVPEKYHPTSGNVPSKSWVESFNLLQEDMSQAQLLCDQMITQKVTFQKDYFWFGRYPGQSFVIVIKLSDDSEVKQLQGKITDHFEKPYLKQLHMTFGYLFKFIPDEELFPVMGELEDFWNFLDAPVTLTRPNVCYFEDMKAFVPMFNRTSHVEISALLLSLWVFGLHVFV